MLVRGPQSYFTLLDPSLKTHYRKDVFMEFTTPTVAVPKMKENGTVSMENLDDPNIFRYWRTRGAYDGSVWATLVWPDRDIKERFLTSK